MEVKILYPTKNSVVSSIDARRTYLIITLIHIYCKSFVNFIVSQASLLVIWIATPHFTKGGQTPVRLAMTKKILSLRGFVKTEVIHKKEILLFWIASLTLAHAVRHMAMTMTKIFNLISFRDYSLLFIKNLLTKEISK